MEGHCVTTQCDALIWLRNLHPFALQEFRLWILHLKIISCYARTKIQHQSGKVKDYFSSSSFQTSRSESSQSLSGYPHDKHDCAIISSSDHTSLQHGQWWVFRVWFIIRPPLIPIRVVLSAFQSYRLGYLILAAAYQSDGRIMIPVLLPVTALA